jgi:hypothetical protein
MGPLSNNHGCTDGFQVLARKLYSKINIDQSDGIPVSRIKSHYTSKWFQA